MPSRDASVVALRRSSAAAMPDTRVARLETGRPARAFADHTGSKLTKNAANPTRITATPCTTKNSTEPDQPPEHAGVRRCRSSSHVVMSLAPEWRFRRAEQRAESADLARAE